MAAVMGNRGRRPSSHLLQHLQAGARTSSCSFFGSAGFVGELSGWVGSFRAPSPFHTRTELKYHTTFELKLHTRFLWPLARGIRKNEVNPEQIF